MLGIERWISGHFELHYEVLPHFESLIMYHQIGGVCSPDSALENGGSECYEPIPQVVANISGAISVQSGYVSEISHPYLFFVFF